MEPENLTNDELLNRLKILVRQEREDLAGIVAHLAEVDHRDLVRERGFPSLFEYCVKELRYSEASAYRRIRVARAIKKRPYMLGLLRAGDLHLHAIVLLHPHLDDERAEDLVQQARGKTGREVEALLAPLSPRPQPRDTIRVMAVEPKSAGGVAMPLFGSPSVAPSEQACSAETASVASSEPLRSQVSFSAGPALLELLGRARGLLWHKYPQGGLEDVFAEALAALLELKDPGFWTASKRRTQSAGRNIPKWIRRRVWRRDGGRCVYKAPDGRCCGRRSGLEFDHVVPWALGGTSNDPANIRLLCHGHNQLTARRVFGDRSPREVGES